MELLISLNMFHLHSININRFCVFVCSVCVTLHYSTLYIHAIPHRVLSCCRAAYCLYASSSSYKCDFDERQKLTQFQLCINRYMREYVKHGIRIDNRKSRTNFDWIWWYAQSNICMNGIAENLTNISTQWHKKNDRERRRMKFGMIDVIVSVVFIWVSPVILMITSMVSCFSRSNSCRNRTSPVSRSTLKTGPEML